VHIEHVYDILLTMETQPATQLECNRHHNDWLTSVIGVICRMTQLTPSNAHSLFNRCQYISTVPELHIELERVGIPRTSKTAQGFVNYWLYADTDERN
jgi:hypothetical protein